MTGTFTGTFNGGGFTISGLNKPLFNVIDGDDSGSVAKHISDLTLEAAAGGVTGSGILAIEVSSGTVIDNVDVTGAVTGIDNVGGLVGSSGGTITHSSATGAVNGSGEYIGGLVGWLKEEATISNSYATGVVTGTGTDEGDVGDGGTDEGDHGIGGLVGYSSGVISDSHAEGNVNGFAQVGGLVGSTGIATNITNSYATGDVSGVDNVGGLVGLLDEAHSITYSYATGNVIGSGEYIGGLVGDSDGIIAYSYATGNVTGNETGEGDPSLYDGVGGLVGYLGGTLSNTYATGIVRGYNYVGGLVGETGGFAGDISNSYATGDVTGSGEGVGGLVGLSDVDITNSYATGDVTGLSEGFFGAVGGLVGFSAGDITSSSATGDVTGSGIGVGGLVGISVGAILFSYSTGEVIGDNVVGGLVGALTVGDLFAEIYDGINGSIGNSYSTGDVSGSQTIGGLVGGIQGTMGSTPYLYNSYAVGDVNGEVSVGGLVGGMLGGSIEYSLASGDVIGDTAVGGLVGLALSPSKISYSYSIGSVPVSGENEFPQLIGSSDLIVGDSDPSSGNCDLFTEDVCYSAEFSWLGLSPADYLESALSVLNAEFEVFDTDDDLNGGLPYLIFNPPFADELEQALSVLNEEFEVFDFAPNLNSGRPYLISNPPLADEDEVVAGVARINSYSLSTQALDVLKKSIGFKAAKSDLSKLDLALLDQVKDGKSAQIIGGKLFSYQSLLTYLSAGSLLQLEINFEANKFLQVWVKSSDDQYVLLGDITFDKDGNAVLPGIEFKKSGQYELIFVNSTKKDLTQPELVNKVSGLTVYVN